MIFFLYRVFFPIALFIFRALYFLWPQKIKELIQDRRYRNSWIPLSSRPILIHASSGEVEYAKAVFRELKKEYPQAPLLVTYFSPSAKKLIQHCPEIDLALPLPWDKKDEIEKFLLFYNPRLALFARTDVWPELAYQLRQKKVPCLLFSATLTKSKIPQIQKFALNQLSEIYCVSPEDQKNLQNQDLLPAVSAQGDTRYDQIQFRLQNPRPVKSSLRPSGEEFIFVAGSTWPQDEKVLLEALQDENYRCILAPHEITESHLKSLENQLKEKNFSFQRYSESQTWNSQILLVDQIGCLQELYTWGHVAFVGGSFKDKVHSVMEPLSAGLAVFVGPYHRNNREALEFQKVLIGEEMAVQCISSAEELKMGLRKFAEQRPSRIKMAQVIQSKIGASQKVARWACLHINQI